MQSSPISTSRYPFTVLLPPKTTRSPIRMCPSWQRMVVPAPIHTSSPSSMRASPRLQYTCAPRATCTMPCVLMWRFRTLKRHRYRSRSASRLTGSVTLRLFPVQQEVVEGALRQHPVQVSLVEVVQGQVHAIREGPPLLPEHLRADAGLHGAHGPAHEGRDELLRLRAYVGEPDGVARSL